MPAVQVKEMLTKATEGKYAVGAFNITSILQMEAVIEASVEEQSPVIIQTSVSPSKQLKPEVFGAAFFVLVKDLSIPVALQLDHCTDLEYCKRCIDAGYTSVMIDASKDVFGDNVSKTAQVVKYAHANGNITVEGELGTVSGVEDQIRVVESEVELCDPDMAARFVEETGVDTLAPAIGTAHGIYQSNNPKIDIERMKNIMIRVNGDSIKAPLVIHGGTGLPESTVHELIRVGGAKYNVSTELKHSWIDSASGYLQKAKGKYDPVEYHRTQMDATKLVVKKLITVLGSSKKG